MSNFSIGISGLTAAQRALEVIGNNIANAATEGYHRQKIELSPKASVREGSLLFGRGVNVESVTRIIDNLLDKEILRQRSSLEQVGRELVTLRTVETALGELSTEDGGLNAAIDRFFNSLQDLSAHPGDAVWQNQAVSDAEAMAGQFRTLGEFLTTLETQIRLETENAVDSINALTSQIAQLNEKIQRVEVGGGYANNLRDQRDKLISDVAALISIETQSRPYGVVDVVVAGIPVVMGAATMELEAGLNEGAKLGISVAGAANYRTDVTGGKIGGLLSLRNTLVSDVHSDLNSLASAIVEQINKHHVQGVGSGGSFTELTGWRMADESESFSDLGLSVTDGKMYVRLTNTTNGEITRDWITIDASEDSLTDIRDKINNSDPDIGIAGLTASVSNSKLTLSADTDYKFDFLPAVLSSPTATVPSPLPGSGDESAPTISVSGIYTGSANDTFTFTVSGTGSVGNGTLGLVVTDGSASTVATVNVGAGYAAGDKLDIGNGIKIALTTGSLNSGETFAVDAFADTDTSGVLSAVGMNTFFSGSRADDIAVCSAISSSPARLATSLGADSSATGMVDNTNALRMAGVKGQTLSSLSSLSCGDFYRKVVTEVGQKIVVRDMREDNIRQIVENLGSRQSEISGVDINKEAAELLIYEQMFQAMAKYINTVQLSMSSLMELL